MTSTELDRDTERAEGEISSPWNVAETPARTLESRACRQKMRGLRKDTVYLCGTKPGVP